jgi:hypothetical protein
LSIAAATAVTIAHWKVIARTKMVWYCILVAFRGLVKADGRIHAGYVIYPRSTEYIYLVQEWRKLRRLLEFLNGREWNVSKSRWGMYPDGWDRIGSNRVEWRENRQYTMSNHIVYYFVEPYPMGLWATAFHPFTFQRSVWKCQMWLPKASTSCHTPSTQRQEVFP